MRITEKCDVWLEQFHSPHDKNLARKLLRKIRLVTDSESSLWLEEALTSNCFEENTAIYIERELQQTRSPLPPPMYKESKSRPRRIEGAAAQAVQSLDYAPQTIGSEGKLATKIDQICSLHKGRLFLQPATSILRKKHIRNFVIVTDLIGSGKRVSRMLDSLWRLQSVKSWRSYKLIKFHVVCYSITQGAEEILIKHPARPNIIKKIVCPTLNYSFDDSDEIEMKILCESYGSFSRNPLGFMRSGALIAFDDKVPNNMPAIFIESSKSLSNPWLPLFPNRRSKGVVGTDSSIAVVEAEMLKLLDCEEILSAPGYKNLSEHSRLAILYVAASSCGYTEVSDFASLTDMSIEQILKARKMASQKGLMTSGKKVTSRGKQSLRKLVDDGIAAVGKTHDVVYYPVQLRAPT
ncbi:phosphoribosyltransferase-like protein [Pseudomonas corrugata]|uniref:phosphoribosyltransferase-like protein n=1 Tax=Pseudomonas corrugata TaxID=47879 RepID=UPI0006D8C4DE|nr:hypothetical protein [Pseudomonas corrugata]